MSQSRFWSLAGFILAAAASRLVPHPMNFTPIGAMALFSGAYFGRRVTAFLVPLAAMLLSDLVIGFHSGMPVVYGCFAVNVLVGMWLQRRRSVVTVPLASLACSLLFFLVTNFAVWQRGSLYPVTWDGLVACYVAALPFFDRTVLGDLFYSTVMFGGFALAERYFASLRETVTSAT